MDKMKHIVKRMMKHNVLVEKDRAILVLTDKSTHDLASRFYKALVSDGWKAKITIMEDRSKSGEEPPTEVAREMLAFELVFCLTKHSLTHTVARKEANKHGVSVITMPGIDEEMFLHGAINADYQRVEKETIEMAEELTKANEVMIETGDGYRLKIPLGEREGIASTGVFRHKAASGNLPSGEAFIAPIEGEASGEIEINGSIAGIGLVREPTLLTIEEGRLVHATGEVGQQLLDLLGEGDGRYLAELGIGTNYAARITGNILEDEKAYQTIHVAFGSNASFGGKIQTDVHIDCVTKNPQITWLKGQK